jgi:predicted aspartyl protease
MTYSFDSHDGLIVVFSEITGPSGSAILRLALDTGATSTLVSPALLIAVGYDPAIGPDRVQVTTGSGIEFVARLAIKRLQALGQSRHDFPLLAHTLPPSSGIDGLLGLDFLRGLTLTVDFRQGQLRLE